MPKGSSWMMSDEVLERFVEQYINGQDSPEIEFSWQGGEPTLCGIDFFQKVVELQRKYCPPHKRVVNTIQTNGTLIDKNWCRFLRRNRFLVGLSVDGPKEIHDRYRTDHNGKSVFDRVVKTAHLLKKEKVEFNTLTVVNRHNAKRPLQVYRFLRNLIGSRYMQFIPCVEPTGFREVAPQQWTDPLPQLDEPRSRPGSPGSMVTAWSVDPLDYGEFLIRIFDTWVTTDIGHVFVINFESALASWIGLPATTCNSSKICGRSLVLEHDGSTYSCDHYVYPPYLLGNISQILLSEMVDLERQVSFGAAKASALPDYCVKCDVLFACQGDCPKNRFLLTLEGEPGLSYLCMGLRNYYRHIDTWMKIMAREVRAGRSADAVMLLARRDERMRNRKEGRR